MSGTRQTIFWLSALALFFLLLYCWSAVGLLFIASKKTSSIKLVIGLVLQAVIVYSLYRWV